MTQDRRWRITRLVHRAAWWVFVVVAVIVGGVPWLDLGGGPSVSYSGSYQPLEGVDMSKAYSTSLEINYDVAGFDPFWVGAVTLLAAVLVVGAAIVEVRSTAAFTWFTVAAVLAPIIAVVIVSVALTGTDQVTPALWVQIVGVLLGIAVHEGAMAATGRRRRQLRSQT